MTHDARVAGEQRETGLKTLVRWLVRFLKLAIVTLLVLVIVAGALLGYLVIRGFPQREGTVRVSALGQQVKVVRDDNGIPNIYAATTEDLFAAQGWVHASERMWQMEVWRHIGAGRLAELFGEDQVDTDRYVRTLGWRHAAEADFAAQSDEAKKALEAYARGVNAWLDEHPDLPLPFVITGLQGAGGGLAGFRPEPWTAIDTLTWAHVQAWSLADNMGSEIFRAVLLRRGLSEAEIAELNPGYDFSRPVVAPASGATGQLHPLATASAPGAQHLSTSAANNLLSATDNLRRQIALAGAGASFAGSNAQAVAGSRSESGAALLANDPHLALSMPSLWYMVGLHCKPVGPACPYELAGVGFPGAPGIVLGHNARIAWGMTNVGPDVQDLFEERLDPNDASHYMYKGQSLPFDVRRETIKVSGGGEVGLDVRSTVHGAVISDVDENMQAGAGADSAHIDIDGYVFALAWADTAARNTTLDSVLAINRAQNWDEFRQAARRFTAPSQTLVYADVDGNIGVQIPGLLPIRADGGDGAYPVVGEDGSHDWTGFIPFDELPYTYNPPDGLIVASNNMPADQSYGRFLGQEFDPGYRATRIRELLSSTDKISTADLRRIQGDAKLTRATPIIGAIGPAAPSSADGQLLRRRILDWAPDLNCGTDSLGCAAYEDFEYWLLRGVFGDELGSGTTGDNSAWRYIGTEVSHEYLARLVGQPDSHWWDDTTTTDKVETRDGVIAAALDTAAAELRKALGDPTGWTWGRIHTATWKEQTLGDSGIAPLEWLFDKGPASVPGSCTTVNKTCGSIASDWPTDGAAPNLTRRFDASTSPSYRFIIDMSKMDDATILNTTGESGLPFDEHYGDLIPRWINNDPVALPWSEARIAAAAKQTLTLNP